MPNENPNPNSQNIPEEIEESQFGEAVDDGYQLNRQRQQPRPKSKQEEKREELTDEARKQIKGKIKEGVGKAADKAIVQPAKAAMQKATQAVVTAARQALAAAAKYITTVAIPFIMANLGWILIPTGAIVAIALILGGIIMYFYCAPIPSPCGKTVTSLFTKDNPSHYGYQQEIMGRYGFPVEADTELARQIATIANSQVGGRESGGGCGPLDYYPNNKCPSRRIDRPWCADFVSWVIAKAGGQMKHIRSARGIENFYDRAGRWSSTPAVGDVYTITRIGGSGRHVGLVVAVNGGTVTVIDGNWDNKVARYNRPASSAVGFGVPYK